MPVGRDTRSAIVGDIGPLLRSRLKYLYHNTACRSTQDLVPELSAVQITHEIKRRDVFPVGCFQIGLNFLRVCHLNRSAKMLFHEYRNVGLGNIKSLIT